TNEKEHTMQRTSMTIKVLRLGVALLPFALPVMSQAAPYNVVSGTFWEVSDSAGTPLGNAQNVCLQATAPMSPSNCPAGATSYGYKGAGWTANLSTIPGATWIWAPNITGATSPAASAEFVFKTYFFICDAPQKGIISVAADDKAEVFLNG